MTLTVTQTGMGGITSASCACRPCSLILAGCLLRVPGLVSNKCSIACEADLAVSGAAIAAVSESVCWPCVWTLASQNAAKLELNQKYFYL